MSKFALAAAIVVALMAHPLHKVDAIEALSSDEFAAHCIEYRNSPDGSDGIFCVRYIQGFIDGAIVTDERVTLNVSKEYDEVESFAQRAIRTRLGKQLERFGPSFYAEYCLGAPVPLPEVVDHVVTRLEQVNFEPKPPLARDFVYRVLREFYPCDPDRTQAQ